MQLFIKFRGLLAGSMGVAFMGLFLLIALGNIYWIWISFQIGSFTMFIVGLFPPFIIVTGPIGAWSLLFGVPYWVTNIFG